MKIYKIIFLLLIPIFSFAQQDSIDENVKRFVEAYYKNDCTIHNHTAFYKEDSLFYENVIDYLSNTIKTDSNYWKTKNTVDLLCYFAYIPNLYIKHKATNYILDIYNYPSIRCSNQKLSWNGIYDFSAEDFDKKAKQKISKFLAGYYSADDFNRHKAVRNKELLTKYNSYHGNYKGKHNIKKLIKKTGKNEKHIRDSINTIWLKRDLPKFKLNKCYPKELLYLVGKNYMHEFIPQIKTLMDTAKGFPVYFSKLVLARMGEEPYVTEVLDSLEKFEFVPNRDVIATLTSQIMFIANNPRSVQILKKWMDTKYSYPQYSRMATKSCSRFATWYLANFLQELPKQYKHHPDNGQYNINTKDSIKHWLEVNNNLILDSMIYFELNGGKGLTIDINKNKYFREKYFKALELAKKELDSKRKN